MKKKEEAVIQGVFELKKYPGKGGWTYFKLPAAEGVNARAFGHLKVKGSIDGYVVRQASMWKIKGGGFFFPVNAGLRKVLGKEAGDEVSVFFTPDHSEAEVPAIILECLREEPALMKKFAALAPSKRNEYVKWIAGAKKEETKINRIAAMMKDLS